MGNVIKTAVVGAVAAVFVASVAIAGGPFDSAQGRPFDSAQGGPFDSAQGRPAGGGDGQVRGRGPGGPGFGGPGGRGGFGVIMRDLTEEQRTQVRAIMEEQREQGPPADAKLRRELEAELLADAPNDAKIEELRQQIITATGEGLSRHIAVQKKIAAILTAEQKAKARERLAERPEGRGGPRRGR